MILKVFSGQSDSTILLLKFKDETKELVFIHDTSQQLNPNF